MDDCLWIIISFIRDITTYHNMRQVCRKFSTASAVHKDTLRKIANSVPGVISDYPEYNNFYLNDLCTFSEFREILSGGRYDGVDYFAPFPYGDAIRRMYLTSDSPVVEVLLTLCGNPIVGTTKYQMSKNRCDLDFWFTDINKSVPMNSLPYGQFFVEIRGENVRSYVEYLHSGSEMPIIFDKFINFERNIRESTYICNPSGTLLSCMCWNNHRITKITLMFDSNEANISDIMLKNNNTDLMPIALREIDTPRGVFTFHLPYIIAQAIYLDCKWDSISPPQVVVVCEYLMQIEMTNDSMYI